MATDIIDTSIGNATFPATYIGPGTIAASVLNAGSVSHDTAGFFTSAGNAVQINLGYQPLEVVVTNITDSLVWTWKYGFPANDTIKLTLGTVAAVLDTTGAIVVSSDPAGNCTVTLSAAAAGTSKAIVFDIEG